MRAISQHDGTDSRFRLGYPLRDVCNSLSTCGEETHTVRVYAGLRIETHFFGTRFADPCWEERGVAGEIW